MSGEKIPESIARVSAHLIRLSASLSAVRKNNPKLTESNDFKKIENIYKSLLISFSRICAIARFNKSLLKINQLGKIYIHKLETRIGRIEAATKRIQRQLDALNEGKTENSNVIPNTRWGDKDPNGSMTTEEIKGRRFKVLMDRGNEKVVPFPIKKRSY